MTEQERFEASIATRIHPVNFTKVNDLPILGWNGAKPNDYVDPKIQQHWITWQAAQQKEGYVLVPVELTYKQALSVARSDFDAGANIFNHEHRHLSNDDKAEIKGRWIGSKAFTIQDQYMALIKAAQEAE